MAVKKYVCPHNCGAGPWADQRGLDAHVNKVHDKARPFHCDHSGCDKTFSSKIVLSVLYPGTINKPTLKNLNRSNVHSMAALKPITYERSLW
ncbi:hypothetical protein VKT23_020402 [Stygiomarasmius scandens]|uniref:C2H2-type domain-containing protein n=1 Tax=Marasmiellus scandens TaxID=2682957 RepID=A0ABR1IMX4_9AGAR